jgi:hypothetical protein
MAQEIVGFKIEINGQERVVQSLGEMKQLIKDANFELLAAQQNFGEYSQEAVNAAKKVATLKDTLQEAGETAQLFDPGRKFQAFAGALNATAGGITAFQGALGLIGVESENVEKSLLKVQSALALSQGLSTITDSVKDFQRLAAVIQSVTLFQKAYQLATIAATAIQRAFGVAVAGTGVAFRALRGAILATGIGALTIGIGVLVSKIMDWANSASEAEKAQNKLAESTKTMNQDIGNQISVLSALGGKEREIYNLRLRQNENELNVLRNKLKTTGKLNEEELAQFKKLKTDKEVLDIQESNRINKDAEDETKKRQEENSKVVEDRKARNKEIQDADKQLREQAIKISDEIFLSEIEDEREKEEVKLALEFERAKKDIENSVGTQAAKNEALLLLQTQYDLQRKEIQQQRAAEEVDILTNKLFAEVQAEQEASDAKIKASQDELDAITNNLLAEVEAEEKASKAKVQIAEYESQFKKQQLDEVGNALQNLSAIAGKETAAGKALGIATALINTYQGASEALKQKSTLPSPFDVIAKVANVAAIVATGIKTVRAITAVEVPGGGGAGVKSPTVSSLSGSAPIIPSAPLVNTRTQLDSTSIQQLGSATNRSYVLESDVTNSQERIRRINRAARLS